MSKIGGKYSGSELVTVNGGGNDLLMQLYGISNAASGGATAVAFGTIAGWSQTTIDAVSRGGTVATSAAVVAAVSSMAQVGTELAGYIKSLVVGKGAKYVLVRNLANVNITPFGLSLDAGTKELVTKMIQLYNAQLKTGLDGTLGVILLDDYALSNDSAANPSKYGYSNVKDQSCGPNPLMSVLVCNTTNLIPGDTSRYAYADDVHTTPYAHRKEAENALALIVSAGWQ